MNKNKLKSVIRTVLLLAVIVYYLYCSINDNTEYVNANLDEDVVYVHFIDVGQGDCALIQSPDGNILIDAGTFDSRHNTIDYINRLGVKEFEFAIFTHPHEDHIGAAKTLIEEYDFENIILPGVVHTTHTYENTIDAIEKEECDVFEAKAGDSYFVGDLKIDVFAPDEYYDDDDLNNMSVVCKITYKEVSLLFTGDAEEESEDSMLYYGYDLDSDILKVGHHGSSTSSTQSFIRAVSPEVAIISAGKDNDYGHPHKETRQLFSTLGVDTHITFEEGSIVVVTDGESYTIKTQK